MALNFNPQDALAYLRDTVSSFRPEQIISDLRAHFRSPMSNVNRIAPAGIVSICFFIGIFSLLLYRHLDHTSDRNPIDRSGVVHNPDAPPIPPPTEIVSMRIYPIKSCRGIEITNTRLRKTGLTLDRNWMFITLSDRTFLTIRSDPSMTLIDTAIITPLNGEQQLRVSIRGTSDCISVPAFPTQAYLDQNTTLSTASIWGAETDAYEYPSSINAIFTKFFNKPVALVYKGPTARNVAVNGRPELYGQPVAHKFADVMSLQIASQASIDDLNARLGHKPNSPEALTIERFRPNIIVAGTQPWEEDTWKRIRITTTLPKDEQMWKIDLDVVARCARCQVPNVDPETAEKDAKEPWDQLMKFRRVDEGGAARWKPCFGMLCIPKMEGKVEIGAKVEVLETTGKHLYDKRGFGEL